MSKRLKNKSIRIAVVGLICLVLLGGFLTMMQSDLSLNNQKKVLNQKLQQMDELVETANEESKQTTKTYDALYQSKAGSLAFMAQNLPNFAPTDAKMKEYQKLLEVSNVLVLDREGNQVAKAQDTVADFTYHRYNQLRTVFSEGGVSEAFAVDFGDHTNRYYGAKIDEQQMIVIEQDGAELAEELLDTTTWNRILGNVTIGQKGYTFVVSDRDYTFLDYPDETVIGTDALEAGIPVENLEKGAFTWLTINGEKLYCGITHVEDAYIICAVPDEEIAASRNVTVGIILFVFFAVMTIIATYGIFVWMEEEQNGNVPENYKKFGSVYYNKVIGRKTAALTVVGIIFILVVSFYMQTLFSLSRQAASNNLHITEVENTLNQNEDKIQLLTEQYNTQYLNKCQIAAYVLSENPALAVKEKLKELRDILEIQELFVFDAKGEEVDSSSALVNFKLSDDPKSQSYEFHKLLNGAEYLIQEAQEDETLGEYHQYIGVSMYDDKGNANGFAQIAIRPSRLENMLVNTKLSKVLDGIKAGAKGFAFAVDKEDQTFVYYPKERLIGRNALEYGMQENQFRDGYSDYITIGNDQYFGSSLETDQDYIYVVVPAQEMSKERLPVTLASTGLSLLFLLLIYILLTFSKVPKAETEEEAAVSDEKRMIDVRMPDGTMKKTESADSRWKNISMKWSEKTAEQQLSTVLKGLVSVLAVLICLAVLFKDRVFDSGSAFLYVLNGKWERGLNVFAVTGCIIIVCVVSVATMLLKKILQMLSKTFGARGETVCRLVISFLKYVSIIAVLYYCFALFGVDTKTLLASAGILTLVIGLGAKTLVSDILAGLFIIFEGEFRVGDIITIGDWRGTVVEIGVRTTKIEDGGKNVKIISNSNVSGIINMTKRYSFAACDVGIEYGESLERVENILEKEFPNIKRRLPAIQDGPFYKGVVSLGDNSVNIRIVAQCAEGDRIQLERDLNREMKLIFDKYDINIPFPQVVINQPTEFEKASVYEKMRADKFNEQQKEASKGIGNEEEEER
ncbi:MAG: mechanosensitive ion channel domain-containing protein [Blautia sp.]